MSDAKRQPGILYEKAKAFSLRIIRLEHYLEQDKKCNKALINQVLRSGTSVAANIAESLNAESSADFSHKLSIALKEADETNYWIESIRDGYDEEQIAYESLLSDLNEIRYMLISSIRKMKNK